MPPNSRYTVKPSKPQVATECPRTGEGGGHDWRLGLAKWNVGYGCVRTAAQGQPQTSRNVSKPWQKNRRETHMAGFMKLTRLSPELLPDCWGWTVVEEVTRGDLPSGGKEHRTGTTGHSVLLTTQDGEEAMAVAERLGRRSTLPKKATSWSLFIISPGEAQGPAHPPAQVQPVPQRKGRKEP